LTEQEHAAAHRALRRAVIFKDQLSLEF
jgi:hypothetical protein